VKLLDMRKFESWQKDESRAQLADSSKAYKKRRAFYRLERVKILMQIMHITLVFMRKKYL